MPAHAPDMLASARDLQAATASVLQRYTGERHAEEIADSARRVAGAQTAQAADRDRAQADPAVARPWLQVALATARDAAQVDEALLDSLEQMLPHARWIKREAAAGQERAFVEQHRHALLLGPGSPVACQTLTLGLAVMAPHTLYPFHQHPPHEFYVVLSAGQWYQHGHGWWQPGLGGLLYNEPSRVHSMQSGEAPLLALWGLMHG